MTRFSEAWYAGRMGPAGKVVDTERPQSIALVLPMPPTVNHSTTPNGRGGRLLSDEHRQFRAEVANIVARLGTGRLEGRLRVSILLFPVDRRGDIDNRIKAVLDALQHAGCFVNDSQVDKLEISRVHGTGRGECSVVIAPL